MSPLPLVGEPGIQFLTARMGQCRKQRGQVHEQLREVELRIDFMAAAGARQAGQDGGGAAAARVADEERVFPVCAVDRAQTLSEAQRRADELRADLTTRGVHPDVLRFCRAELVADNYFHAVLEATKSITEKLRVKSGLREDGAKLVDATLCGSAPRIAINDLVTDSQRSEQSGFANLVKGVFGMFRNPTAHEARVLWRMSKEDAEDLLSVASLIHRRIDAAR